MIPIAADGIRRLAIGICLYLPLVCVLVLCVLLVIPYLVLERSLLRVLQLLLCGDVGYSFVRFS